MNALSQTDELVLFETDLIRDLIQYKWECFSKKVHGVGLINHTMYCIAMQVYFCEVMLQDIPKKDDGTLDLEFDRVGYGPPAHMYVLCFNGFNLTYSIFYEMI